MLYFAVQYEYFYFFYSRNSLVHVGLEKALQRKAFQQLTGWFSTDNRLIFDSWQVYFQQLTVFFRQLTGLFSTVDGFIFNSWQTIFNSWQIYFDIWQVYFQRMSDLLLTADSIISNYWHVYFNFWPIYFLSFKGWIFLIWIG